MQRRENFLPFFLVFFGMSIALIFLGRSGMFDNFTSIFNRTASPSKSFVNILTLNSLQDKKIKSLVEENFKLRKKQIADTEIVNENVALKSQFATSADKSQSLIPAKIIGSPGFIPGVNLPDYLIINKGTKDGLRVGVAVVVENNLVGKIAKIYPDFSKVDLVSDKNSSFTAKIAGDAEINGVVKGQGGGEMILDNVLLSAELKKDLTVLTKGDIDENGNGYPPDLIVGKLISIEKKQSDLFQKAKVLSPLDFKNLTTVFVIK